MKSFTGTDVIRVEAEVSEGVLSRKVLEQSFDRLLAANGPALTRLAAAWPDDQHPVSGQFLFRIVTQ